MFISYAQNFEDVMLWRALRHVDEGFYIDIGAQDPVADSVSLAFYEHGWRGMHVEPVPEHAAALRLARADEIVVESAIGTEAGLIDLFEIPGTGLSTGNSDIARSHSDSGLHNHRLVVPCITLAALFDRVGDRDVHWLKIDVEGMEASVLRSWSPSQVRPWIVVVEATVPRSPEPSFEDWEPVILGLGYTMAYFDGLNRFYVSGAHSNLHAAFQAPPNVFDGFALSGKACNSFCEKLNAVIADERSALNRSVANLQQLQLYRDSADAALDSLKDQHSDLSAREIATREQLQIALDTMRVAALAQNEDRESLRAAHANLESSQKRGQELDAELLALNALQLERQSQWDGIAESLRAELAKVTFRADRQARASEQHSAELTGQLAAVKSRHEIQVSLYLDAIARAEALAQPTRLAPESQKRGSALRWPRFDDVTSNPIINVLFGLKHSSVNVTELVMDAPIFTRTNYQPSFVLNTNGRYQIDDFLSLHDRAFVDAAYQAILQRRADPQGEAFYLAQIRSGETKSRILAQILRSDEAKKHGTVIAGLDRHLRLTRLCELPVIGRFLAAMFFLVNVNDHMRELRAFQNHVIRIAEEAQIIHESNMHKLRSIS